MLGCLRGHRRFYFRDRSDALVHSFETAVAALEDETLAGGVNARFRRTPGTLLITNLEDRVFVGAHAEHSRDPIGRISLEVLLYIFGGEELLVLIQADGGPKVDM